MTHLHLRPGDGRTTGDELDDHDARREQVDVGVVESELNEDGASPRVDPFVLLQLPHQSLRRAQTPPEVERVAASLQCHMQQFPDVSDTKRVLQKCSTETYCF